MKDENPQTRSEDLWQPETLVHPEGVCFATGHEYD